MRRRWAPRRRSALDPLSTFRIEELIGELKQQYTNAIVTHNLQPASRVSDFTVCMLAGEDRVGHLSNMVSPR